MDERKWKVYVHENKINGKRYVGITSKKNANSRWRNGKGYGYSTHLNSAIKKYGWHTGFYHYIIAEGLTRQEAEDMEVNFIRVWGLKNDDLGYNMTDGGEGSSNTVFSKDVLKKKMEIITNLNKEKRIKVVCLNTQKVYESISEANKSRGVCASNSNIGLCCANKMRYVGIDEEGNGLQWCYFEDFEEKIKTYKPIVASKSMNIKVVVNLNSLMVYESAKVASEYMGVDPSSIIKCCKRKQKSIRTKSGEKLKWMYYKEYIEITNKEILGLFD